MSLKVKISRSTIACRNSSLSRLAIVEYVFHLENPLYANIVHRNIVVTGIDGTASLVH